MAENGHAGLSVAVAVLFVQAAVSRRGRVGRRHKRGMP